MNDRFRSEASRRESQWRERGRSGASGWREGPGGGAGYSGGPQYSSDEDETYGSEWQRDRGQASSFGRGDDDRGDFGRNRSGFGQGGSNYGRGDAYGSGGFGPQRGFGSGFQQGYRGRDISGPGADLNRNRDFGPNDFGPSSEWRGGESRGVEWRGGRYPESRGGGYSGRGPKGYTRSDERIREDVCERLSQDDDVDASEIEVSVKDGEVTLSGTVITRHMKQDAEDIAESVSGVSDVHNQLRVLKGVIGELKDKLSGNQPEQHFAGGGTKNDPSTVSNQRSS